jgi:hypothetical protein
VAEFRYYNWEEVDINWEAVDMNWEAVGILISDVLPYISVPLSSGPRKYDLDKINKLPEEKKRIIIKVACEIEGSEYISYKYKNDDVTVTAKHIDTIVDKLLKNVVKVSISDVK